MLPLAIAIVNRVLAASASFCPLSDVTAGIHLPPLCKSIPNRKYQKNLSAVADAGSFSAENAGPVAGSWKTIPARKTRRRTPPSRPVPSRCAFHIS